MNFFKSFHHTAEEISIVLGIPQKNPGQDAFWQGVDDGVTLYPDLGHNARSFPNRIEQDAYDTGVCIGASKHTSRMFRDDDLSPVDIQVENSNSNATR